MRKGKAVNTATGTEFPALTDVVSVYSGKAGKCCCGCSGKHRVASAHRQAAAKSRGYAVDDDEVSDRSVKLIYRKVKAAIEAGNDEGNRGPDCWSVDIGNRTLCVYTR
jgi:hypothetical protein